MEPFRIGSIDRFVVADHLVFEGSRIFKACLSFKAPALQV